MGRGLRAWDVTSRNLELYQRSAVPRQAYPGTTPSDYGSDVERRRWVLFSCEAEVRPRIDQDVCLIPSGARVSHHGIAAVYYLLFSTTCLDHRTRVPCMLPGVKIPQYVEFGTYRTYRQYRFFLVTTYMYSLYVGRCLNVAWPDY